MDSILHLVGIAKKAGRLEVGEEPVGAAARARQAKLILVASDAAENTVRGLPFRPAGQCALAEGRLYQGGAGRAQWGAPPARWQR